MYSMYIDILYIIFATCLLLNFQGPIYVQDVNYMYTFSITRRKSIIPHREYILFSLLFSSNGDHSEQLREIQTAFQVRCHRLWVQTHMEQCTKRQSRLEG